MPQARLCTTENSSCTCRDSKKQGKSLHDRMDAPAGVTDFLPAEESARQSQEALNLSFLESAGKNKTFHKCQAFDRSTNLGIKIYLAPS
jgi:hypothetical protein